MFKNKSFNVKMIDDPAMSYTPLNIPKKEIDYDKINASVKQHIITVGAVVAGIVVAKNLSYTLGGAVRDVTWRIIDVKYPYPK